MWRFFFSTYNFAPFNASLFGNFTIEIYNAACNLLAAQLQSLDNPETENLDG
jgi:hypothetical protein